MDNEHRARITWSSEHVRLGLPTFSQTTDPSWLDGAEEGWSLVCVFDRPPRVQGNPSVARVRFLMEEAPPLTPGTTIQLFERATSQRATVEILE